MVWLADRCIGNHTLHSWQTVLTVHPPCWCVAPPNLCAHVTGRGRHTPRSRLSTDWSDLLAGANAMYGGQIDQRDIDAYQQHLFATDSLGAPDAVGRSGAQGATLGSMPSPRDSQQQPHQQGFGGQQHQHQQLMQEQLTGQMQQALMLNDSTRVSIEHLTANSLAAAEMIAGAGMNLNLGGMQHMEMADGQQAALAGAMPNNRKLLHCESDSFKRFLIQSVPFENTLGSTPEATYEGQVARGMVSNLME